MMNPQAQRNQMHYAPVHYPTIPPQMYYGNYPPESHGYMHCHGHGCCNHNYFPGHSPHPYPYPYHHHMSPSPVPSFYPFCYPPAQGMYPPPPYFPPPHRTTELPQYEYDMDMSRGGRGDCCGRCTNHPCGGKQEKDVKIEEVEPEVEKKTNGSLVPFEDKNYPFPIVWFQPDKETTKPDDSRCKGWGGQANEDPKSFSQQPNSWNGWFPYDMKRVQSSNQEEEQKNTIQQLQEGAKSQQPGMWRGCFPSDLSKLETMKQGEEKGSNQHRKDDEKKRNFPFPVFWMPYKPSLTEREEEPQKTTESDTSKKTESGVGKVASHIINSQPEKHIVNEEKSKDITKKKTSGEAEVPSHIITFQPEKRTDKKEKPEINTTSEGSTNRVVKIIPVKQLVSQVEGNLKASSKTEDERKKKPLDKCVNKASTSPRKMSKLPPVCLRVEPLPKRKGTKSRSPSPPGNKRKSDDPSAKQDGLILLPNLQQNERIDDQVTTATDRSSKEEKIGNNTGTPAKVAEQADRQELEVKFPGRSGDTLSHADATKHLNECNEEPAADSDNVWKESGDLEAKLAETDAQSVTTQDSSAKAEENTKRKFSNAEAATVIQAAYHGFEVRKLGTLQKLKKLAQVKEKVEGIKTQIQALRSSCDVKTYDKQKTIITEMIMGLLLKLDTVQGLHTSIRDVRKSIAKELVSLQESLDALVIREKSSEAQLEQPSGISFEESMPNLKNEDITIECQRKDNGVDIHESSKIDHKVSPPVELCEKQVRQSVSLPNPEELEKSEAMVTREGVDDEVKNVPGCISTEYFPGASDSAAVVGGSKKEQNKFQSPMADSSGDDEELELKQLFESQDLSKVMSNVEDVSKEEIGKEALNVLQLAVNDESLSSEDTSNDDAKKEEVSDDAVKDIAGVDEVIILNQEQVALEESQEGSQECKEEEKIADGTLSERPHESNGMSMSPSGENSILETLIEVPNESTNTCEADETTRAEIPTASEEAADSWEHDETVSRGLSGVGQQVNVLPENQKEQSLIDTSDPVHDEVQFEQSTPQGIDSGWERDTGSEAGSETAVPQHKCLNEVSPLEHDALHVEMQEEDHGQGVDSLSESVSCNDDVGLLLTTCEGVTGGLRKECGHLSNEESGGIEELQENDYVFVSGGSTSEVSPDSCIEKSEEIVTIVADEMENISPVVIPREKMDATCLAPEDSEGTQHVTGTNNIQANELDLSVSSPTASQSSLESETARELDRKLLEENEKLRDMMEKLLEAGSKQFITISELSGRINDLEKRLARKKKKQLKCRIRPKALPPREVLV